MTQIAYMAGNSNSRVHVYVASSIDGFIAGPDDDLGWLPQPEGPAPPDYGFAQFMNRTGALLMGRRTYDIAQGFDGAWPYGDRPVLVATHRTLSPIRPSVRAVRGDIHELIAAAKITATSKPIIPWGK